MKLSTRGRYGVTAMYDLALNYNVQSPEPVSLKSIASRQGISEHYLEQLMGKLRRAGLVQSIRGAMGGYFLKRSPHEITVGEIIRVMEGPISLVDCLLAENTTDKKYCEKSQQCVTRKVWSQVSIGIANTLDKITLQDLCESYGDCFDDKK